MKKYTLKEFFLKLEWEGGFEGMANYAGVVEIVDNEDLNNAWKQFVPALQDLKDLYEEWEENLPEEDDS